jgi:pimeloyl-ACP methyl ester carboxylesterase
MAADDPTYSASRSRLIRLGPTMTGRFRRGEDDESAVVWIHGHGMNAECWTPLWDRLPPYTHVGIDLPGHGYSLPLAPGTDLPALAHEVAVGAHQQGARHLVGMSLGCMLALQVALQGDPGFDTVTLIGPVLGGGPYDEDIWARYSRLRLMRAEGASVDELTEHWTSGDSAIFGGVDPSGALSEHLRHGVAPHGWWDLDDSSYTPVWQWPQALRDLARMTSPTLVLVGAHDRPAVHATVALLGRVLPNCTSVQLPDSHHLCALESPEQAAAALSRHWRVGAYLE